MPSSLLNQQWKQKKRIPSLAVEERTDPEQIQSLIDKPYIVDQIKHKIE
jgi:hypothetical protein